MRNKETSAIKLKKAEKMLFRVTIWGGIITGIFITLIMLFVK